MNLTEILLSNEIDGAKVALPEKEMEIKRLSAVYKQPFIVKFMAITPDEEDEIQKDCMTITKDEVQLESAEMKYRTLGACLIDPDIKNKDLQKKFKAANYMEFLKTMFLPGEVSSIYDEIQKISGYGKDKVKEVKNL